MNDLIAPTVRKKRVDIHDIRSQKDSYFFVINNAVKMVRTNAVQLLTHTTGDGRQIPLKIPATWIPYDLARFADKEELVRNHYLLETISKGYIELMLTVDAKKILDTPEAVAEMDRLYREETLTIAETTGDLQMAPNPQNVPNQPPAAPGKDLDLAPGVHPSVVEIVGNDASMIEKSSLLRNLLPILTDSDKAHIRQNLSDEGILKLIA